MITIVVNITIWPENIDAFIIATKISQTASINEPGCRDYIIMQDNSEYNKFILIEHYDDEYAIELHKQTKHFKIWKDTIQDMNFVKIKTSTKNTII